MSYLPEAGLRDTFEPFVFFRENFGFVPNLFRAQTLLPRVIEAETRIAAAVLHKESSLSRTQKECILLTIAATHRNSYCVTAHSQMLSALGMSKDQLDRIVNDHHHAGLSDADAALLDFGLKLSRRPTWVKEEDIEGLRLHGFEDEQILEGVLVTALTEFLCTLSMGLGVPPDFEPRQISSGVMPPPYGEVPRLGMRGHAKPPRPYLRAVDLDPSTFPPFAFFRERFGFIPNIFRAQTLRPDVIEAEAGVVGTVLLSDDVLSRVRKEYILLVVSASNLNTYCVAVHCEMLRALGVSENEADQVAVDHHRAGLSEADRALLDFVLKLSERPDEFCSADMDELRKHGFTEEQILESVVMTALTNFLNTLQMGLGTTPDFEPRRVFLPEPAVEQPGNKLDLFGGVSNLTEDSAFPSPAGPSAEADFLLIARVQGGDLSAFEELIRRHGGRVYRAVLGITRNAEDAEDGIQSAFLKAFEHIGEFQGASKFSTWLMRIAINEGLLLLRRQKSLTSLDESEPEEMEEFRPREVRAWDDNPEQLYSRAQIQELVERELMKLPAKYRIAVMLRDIEQLSTVEAAAALGLGVPTLKSRLLRGRLMLREALAPYFAKGGRGSARA